MQREAECGRTINHPLLLGARELRDSKQGPYLLMDLFVSRNLREVMLECRTAMLPWLHGIARQAAAALAHLHSLQWLHLDVKPDNLLLNEHGEARLIDFSLSRRVPNWFDRLLWKTTRDKLVRGTRSYMSPEVIRRDPVDARSDIYSFGCTLFHLAAGTQPYSAASSNELLRQHLNAKVPNLSAVNPEVTPRLSKLVAAMMQKKPENRPASMDEVVRELATMRFFTWQPDEAEVPPAPAA